QIMRYYSSDKMDGVTSITHKNLEVADFQYLLKLDERIFDRYWRNSSNSFHETLKSCVNNNLFLQKNNGELIGYAILGETRKLSYLQRIGVDKSYQGLGYGEELLQSVLSFSKQKKFLSMKLNTQETNESALNLYKKNGFRVQKNKLIIMSSTQNSET
ncbi:GNAT family N-acetyltransferase, partial [Candidatus Actinomarina]|nr:GNAT family N-acetyltransferase [Candidatus Actinomarina sp.]